MKKFCKNLRTHATKIKKDDFTNNKRRNISQ